MAMAQESLKEDGLGIVVTGCLHDENDPLLKVLDKHHSVQNSSTEPNNDRNGKSKTYGAVFIVINAAMGAGLLAFPYAYSLTGGWQFGVVIQLLLLPFIIGGLVILAYCGELNQTDSYEGIMEHMFGLSMRLLTECLVFIYCFGTTVTFLVVMGDQIEDITSAFTIKNKPLSSYWWASRKFTVTISACIFIYPWIYLKRIGVLSYTSFLGVLCCVYIAVVVFVKYFKSSFECTAPRELPSPYSVSWITAFNAIPYICFAFQCHISAVPIYAGLKTRTLKNFFGIILVGLLICTVVYTVTGVFGEITFAHRQEYINADVLRNYCPTDISISVARGMLLLCLITSYPILFFCGRTALDSVLLRLYAVLKRHWKRRFQKPQNSMTSNAVYYCSPSTIRRVVLSNVWFLASLVLALFVPQVKYVISPMGCLAGVFIFVFPGLCILKLGLNNHFHSKALNKFLVICCCLQTAIGMFVLGNDLVYNIMVDFSLN